MFLFIDGVCKFVIVCFVNSIFVSLPPHTHTQSKQVGSFVSKDNVAVTHTAVDSLKFMSPFSSFLRFMRKNKSFRKCIQTCQLAR